MQAIRVQAAPPGGCPQGWIAPVRFQQHQRVAVRGRRAWMRSGSRSIEFHRVDHMQFIPIEGMDGWGPVRYQHSSQSMWMDPFGREHPSLAAAIAACS